MRKNIVILLLIVLVFVSYIPPIITLAFPRNGKFENGLACFHLGAFRDKSYTMCITTWAAEEPIPPAFVPVPIPVDG